MIHECKECMSTTIHGDPIYLGAWLIQSDDMDSDIEVRVDVRGMCEVDVSDPSGATAMTLTVKQVRALRTICDLALEKMEMGGE